MQAGQWLPQAHHGADTCFVGVVSANVTCCLPGLNSAPWRIHVAAQAAVKHEGELVIAAIGPAGHRLLKSMRVVAVTETVFWG